MLKFTDFNTNDNSQKLNEKKNLDPTNSNVDEEIIDKQTKKSQLRKEKAVDTKKNVKIMKDNYKEDIKNNPDDQVDIASSNEGMATFIGKIINFKLNTHPQTAMNYLNENRISPNNFWYYLIEQNNELHIVKYNESKGVDVKFLIEKLINYYLKNNKITENITEMKVAGNPNFTVIKKMPPTTQKILKNDILKLLSDENFNI